MLILATAGLRGRFLSGHSGPAKLRGHPAPHTTTTIHGQKGTQKDKVKQGSPDYTSSSVSPTLSAPVPTGFSNCGERPVPA